MMKKITLLDGMAIIIWLLPIVYLFFIYQSLPQLVPMHYDINGNVNSYGSKNEFLLVQVVIEFVAVLVYLLMKFLPAIDPKKQVKYGEATFQKLAFGIIVFLSALDIVIIFSAAHHEFKIDKLILPIVGLLFVFMGNIMNSIKPNYFAGIRTPWTLESEDTWRATHRLGSKLWFFGGLIITIATLLLSAKWATIVFTASVLVMAFVPFIYSYVYFKKHQIN